VGRDQEILMALNILVVEDDFTSRRVLSHILESFGVCDVAVDGEEAVEAVRLGLDDERQYDLICLDIMMPRMDGQAALKAIRALEDSYSILPGSGAKIIITSALDDSSNVLQAFRSQCDGYIVKPYDRQKIGFLTRICAYKS
jgi:two-component system chemotaxis response regulator CheY